MASTMIHLCVAQEINKKIGHNRKELLLGSIAPDINQLLGFKREVSHFEDNDYYSPNLSNFLDKYGNKMNDDFILGYYIHLYTDYIWFKYFMNDISYKNMVKFLDGSVLELSEDDFYKFVYNDYTNLGIRLIDEYNLDLSLFYEPLIVPKIKMDEIPVEKLQSLLDAAGVIIANTKVSKGYLFDMDGIKKFITFATDVILTDIEKYI